MTGRSAQRKVGRIEEKYGLTDLDEALRERYADGRSLRELADYVNRRITEAFLDDGSYPSKYVYAVLGGDEDVSASERNDLRRRLRADGYDLEELRTDWVSHMAVRSYLQSDLDVDTTRERARTRGPMATLEKIRGLVNRDEQIVEEALTVTAGVDVDGLSIHTDVYVMDEATGETERIEQFLRDLAASDDADVESVD